MSRRVRLLLGSMIALVGMLALAPGLEAIRAADTSGGTIPPNNSSQVHLQQQADPESAKALHKRLGST